MLKYFFNEGVKGLKHNLTTTVGTIVTIFLSLFLVGLFTLAGNVLNNVMDSIESQVSVTAYISDNYSVAKVAKEDATDEEKATTQQAENERQAKIDAVMNEFKSLDGVESVTITSKEQAMNDFKATMENEDIVSQLDGNNPLPASFELTLNDPEKVETIAKTIENSEAFKEICDNPENPSQSVKYGQKTVEKLFSITNTVRFIGAVLIIVLVFIALVFMNNTIRLAVMNRRKEIAIQRLVGASNGFIRGPFLAEGAIHAIIGALLAILFLELIRNLALPSIASTLAWLPMGLSIWTYLGMYAIIIIAGLLIGFIGSALAMRKYLKA